jgi:hypothetical protein
MEGVRIVAVWAATAWAYEAERQEARRARTRAVAAITALEKQRSDDDDEVFSENTDRGLAQI